MATRPSADPRTKTDGGSGTMPPCFSPSGLVRKREIGHSDEAFTPPYLSNPIFSISR